MTAAHVTGRLADWQTALRAENKAPGTVAIYVDGAAPGTARTRQLAETLLVYLDEREQHPLRRHPISGSG